ncbi:hypothetical protein SKAU_G00106360 [Synaphobranchus kaupii]|uniref:Uncharacterized protein n=1 Tax=Synaphobranchus kaupii TaxID=118154 RepID=A0A9Q1J7Z0_SYNKA|nr:hypothetical protein SKAU_G00106360 [Synaphobranchus kaupii]
MLIQKGRFQPSEETGNASRLQVCLVGNAGDPVRGLRKAYGAHSTDDCARRNRAGPGRVWARTIFTMVVRAHVSGRHAVVKQHMRRGRHRLGQELCPGSSAGLAAAGFSLTSSLQHYPERAGIRRCRQTPSRTPARPFDSEEGSAGLSAASLVAQAGPNGLVSAPQLEGPDACHVQSVPAFGLAEINGPGSVNAHIAFPINTGIGRAGNERKSLTRGRARPAPPVQHGASVVRSRDDGVPPSERGWARMAAITQGEVLPYQGACRGHFQTWRYVSGPYSLVPSCSGGFKGAHPKRRSETWEVEWEGVNEDLCTLSAVGVATVARISTFQRDCWVQGRAARGEINGAGQSHEMERPERCLAVSPNQRVRGCYVTGGQQVAGPPYYTELFRLRAFQCISIEFQQCHVFCSNILWGRLLCVLSEGHVNNQAEKGGGEVGRPGSVEDLPVASSQLIAATDKGLGLQWDRSLPLTPVGMLALALSTSMLQHRN